MKKGLSILAYGDEHIQECNNLIKNLIKYKDSLDFFVGTDNKEKIIKDDSIHTIDILDSFNFNLKRIPIKESLNNSDLVIMMDTDHFLMNQNIDFSVLDDIEDGIYINWVDNNVEFMNERITIESLLNGRTKSYINNEYLRKLYELNDTGLDLFFINECLFIIKLTDETKKNDFINNWDYIFKETEYTQPNNGNIGAMEGLIIYLSCIKSGIEVKEVKNYQKIDKFFRNFYHYTSEENKKEINDAVKNKRII